MIIITKTIEALCKYKADLKAILFYKSRVRLYFFLLVMLPYLFMPTYTKAAITFKSGFENGVTMSDFLPGTNWYKKIYGSDQGYDWETDLPGGSNNYWNLILNRSVFPNPSECLNLDISSSQAHTGSRSLHMKVIKLCRYNSVQARVSYLPKVGLWPYDETYIKYWLKFPSDFATKLKAGGTSGGANLNEIRMSDASMRIVFEVVTINGGDLFWRGYAEDYKTSGWQPFWIETASNPPVPIGEWFQVEIYFKPKTYVEGGGAYWVKINGTKIIEVIPTATKRICGKSNGSATCSNPSDWNLLKLYTFKNDIEAWLDDLEIYDTLPSAKDSIKSPPEAPTGLRLILEP